MEEEEYKKNFDKAIKDFGLQTKSEKIRERLEQLPSKIKEEIKARKLKGLSKKQLNKILSHRLSYKKGKAITKRATINLRSKIKPQPYRSLYFR